MVLTAPLRTPGGGEGKLVACTRSRAELCGLEVKHFWESFMESSCEFSSRFFSTSTASILVACRSSSVMYRQAGTTGTAPPVGGQTAGGGGAEVSVPGGRDGRVELKTRLCSYVLFFSGTSAALRPLLMTPAMWALPWIFLTTPTWKSSIKEDAGPA